MPTTITPLLPSVPPPALGLGLGLRRSVSEGVGPPPRPLVAPPSAAGAGARPALQQLQQQWRASVSVEDRQEIRKKIRQAYSSTCPTYEDLLQLVVAIDEEFIHMSAPSRLDYFKTGSQFGKRLLQKQTKMKDSTDTMDLSGCDSPTAAESGETVPAANKGGARQRPVLKKARSLPSS